MAQHRGTAHPDLCGSLASMATGAKDDASPTWDPTRTHGRAPPRHPGGPTPPRAAAPILSIASHQRVGLGSARGAAGRWVPSLSPLAAGLQDKPTAAGTSLPPAPLCCTAEPRRLSFCPWPGRGLVVLCFCSCCKLTAKVSLYTEYLQILIYICISFCYSIFICSGSTNAVFFLFTDATGQENDGGFVWPVGFVCVTVEDLFVLGWGGRR